MPPIALQALALILLIGGTLLLLRVTAASFARFPRRSQRTIALATAGALIGAPFWWAAAPGSFAWALPPLAFRYLAAAALAFGTMGLTVLMRPSPARIRLYLGMVALYLAPVVAAVLLLHRDRLDWGASISWGFVAVAGGLTVAATLEMLRSPDLRHGTAPGAAERGLWTLLAVLFALWALALFALPAGPLRALWLWPQDPLSARLIAVMPATLALIAWMARSRAELGRLAGIGFATYGFWVAFASVQHGLSGHPLPWLYLAALGLAGVWGLVRALRP